MEPEQTQVTQATQATAGAPAHAATERLNYAYLAIIGVAIGLVAPFTGLAWPVAILIGLILGLAAVERANGIQQRGAVHLLRALALVAGTIVMFIVGAIIGAIIALLIVGLAAFSERVSANAGPTDRVIGRILITIITVVVWFVILNVVKLNTNITIGG